MKKDIEIIRQLAQSYLEICNEDIQDKRRSLWRKHNSLKMTRPLIYTRAFAWKEMPESQCKCENPLFREHEEKLRKKIFWHSLDDDSIFEPWLEMGVVFKFSGWGINIAKHSTGELGGAYKTDYPLKSLDDITKMRAPLHEIDEAETAKNLSMLQDAVGDVIMINLDRGPACRMWTGDISTDLGHLRGIENIMMDMMDNPQWMHEILAFMRDGIMQNHEMAEAAGDWGLCAHQNQAMPYSEELRDPVPNANGVKRSELWGYMAAQEYTLISPAMHDEFLLQYQLPILKKFGLVAYGCCEDLTRKIDMLRQIPNLRRIAVSPFADLKKCAEQIGSDYILSYRPNPAEIAETLNPDRVRTSIKHALEICKANGCHTDITLKDVETVQGNPDRVREWVKEVRAAIDKDW